MYVHLHVSCPLKSMICTVHFQRSQPPPKNNKWRQKHEEFIESLHYARKVATVQAKGGNIANLPPPPRSQNPDYVPCPYCERRFNKDVAERHIPRCKETKARPAPPKKRKWIYWVVRFLEDSAVQWSMTMWHCLAENSAVQWCMTIRQGVVENCCSVWHVLALFCVLRNDMVNGAQLCNT